MYVCRVSYLCIVLFVHVFLQVVVSFVPFIYLFRSFLLSLVRSVALPLFL